MDGQRDDGRKVITIAHPEQSSGELKISALSGAMVVMVFLFLHENIIIIIIIIINGFLINLQVQGQHPHQWAPFKVAGLLYIWQISH